MENTGRINVKVIWEEYQDELYTYFGKCECGNSSVIVGSKFCAECGKKISNPLRQYLQNK